MKISSRFSYALKALVDLAIHQGVGPVTVAAIAKRQAIPARSLEQLFNRLRRSGLVQAERGPRGGYRLSRPPKQIPIRAVFDALEPKPGPLPRRRVIRVDGPAGALWRQVEAAVKATLEATTLEAMAAQARDQAAAPIDHRFTFHI